MSITSDNVKELTKDQTEDGDHDLFSHYVKKTDLEKAIFDGMSIKALCGKMWLPTRDYAKYPVCPTCKEIYDSMWRD